MKNVTIIIILLFTINACKPIEQKEEIIQYHVNSEIKSYFGSFKEGSWWAYQDTVSGIIDTFKCVKKFDEAKMDCFFEKDNKRVYASNIYYRLNHNNIPGTSRKYWTFEVQTSCDVETETTITLTFQSGVYTTFYFTDTKLEPTVVFNQDSIISTFYPVFSLNGTNFQDVYYIENTKNNNSGVGSYENYNFIISKNVGLIGFNSKNHFDNNWGAYWVLIDKNIIL